jgi:hypothetical protein
MYERRYGALGGVVFAVLSVAALATMPKPPDADASAATVRHYFAAHSGAIRAGSVLAALAALGFLALVATLRRRVDGSAADTLFAGGAVVAAVAILGAVLQAGLASAQSRLADPGVLGAFTAERMVFYVAPAVATIIVGLSAAVAFRGALPGWLVAASGLLGLVAMVAGIATMVSESNAAGAIGLVGFILTILWSAATAVVLLREPRLA